MYKPKSPFNVPAQLLVCSYDRVNGRQTTSYVEDMKFWCSAKSYGGTERVINNVVVVEDTIEIETWYTPRIKSNCRVKLLDDDSLYEIVTPPENIERKNRFLKFKIKRVAGGA